MRITHVAMVTALVAATACNSDKLTNVNTNPNNPTDAPVGPVFTNATISAVPRWMNNFRYAGLLAGQTAEVQYPDEDRYVRLDASSTGGLLTAPYSGELEDYQQVINKGVALKRPATYGPALVMQAWDISYMTDAFGDIPWSQALKADSGVFSPAYDTQQAVYTAMFAQLTKAVTDMAASVAGEPTLGSADPIYQGTLANWQKFANTLHARMAMRLANVDPATASAELGKAFAAPGGVFASNADNAQLKYPGDGVSDNPIAGLLKTRDDFRMSQTLMNLMLGLSDPRVPIYAAPTVDFTNGKAGAVQFAGMPNGLLTDSAGKYFNIASRPGLIFYPGGTAYGTIGANGGKQPLIFMTFEELSFIKAEAAERSMGGLAPGAAAGFYNAGITASMQRWSTYVGATQVTPAQITAYLAQPSVAYQGGAAGLKQIATQKYIALFTDGYNAWAEWRRTCIPSNIKHGPGTIVAYVPRRYYYPTAETSANGSSVAAAVAHQGPDNFATPVWWDTKASAAPTYTSASVCTGA
ncbi:MAG: SusD/RagB family nutrient-binding outer membrane lipoprotein [bacterium]